MNDVRDKQRARVPQVGFLSGGDRFRVGKKVDVVVGCQSFGVDVGIGEVQCLVSESFKKVVPGRKRLQVLPVEEHYFSKDDDEWKE